MKWLESFKIAIIEEDITAVDTLLKEIPEFKKIDDMREAYALIGEAKRKFEETQLDIQKKMNKMQHSKKFLNSNIRRSSFDEVY